MAMPPFQGNRRRFLRTTGATGAALLLPRVLRAAAPPAALRQKKTPAAKERPGICIIGYGSRAAVLAEDALRHGDIVAVSDVDQAHLEAATTAFPRAIAFRDYRRLLDRDDVNVVLNATPDHWHTLVNLHAFAAGKDVFCEAPLTHSYDEGPRIVQAVKKTKRILQTGLQFRSDAGFRQACELVRNGRIGKVRHVIIGLPDTAPQTGPFLPRPIPEVLDWDRWLGPAPLAAYEPERCHGNFRWWWDYSAGVLADHGVHLLDIALWGTGLERSAPTTIEAQPLSRPMLGGYTAVARFTIKYTFENKLAFTCTTAAPVGVRFEGSTGWIFVSREELTASDPKLIQRPLLLTARRLYASQDHMANFFESVRSRRAPAADAETGQRAALLCHLGAIGLRVGPSLGWNPAKGRFINDPEADALLVREQRKPFTYEMMG